MKRMSIVAAPAALALALAGCSASTDAVQSDPTKGPLTVLASFYPLQYLAEEIGGELVDVESLTPAGAEPHDLELSPAKVAEVANADLVVYLSGFQGAVDDAIAQNPPANVLDVAQAVQLVAATGGNHVADEHDHGHEDEDAASGAQSTTDEHADEETHDHEHEGEDAASGAQSTTDEHADEEAHEDEHEHEESSTDPHFWLDPQRMGQAATAIGQALAKADPANAQTYTKNAGAVTKAMNDLSTELVDGTAQCTLHTFVTSHEAFGYLADRTGLTQVGISGLDPETAPSPARLAEISETVKAEGVTTIFTEALVDPKVAETLASDLGVTTAVLDPIESQTDENVDYAGAMRANIDALRKALQCQ